MTIKRLDFLYSTSYCMRRKEDREKGRGKMRFLMLNYGSGQHQFLFFVYPLVYTTVATILSGVHIQTIIKLTGYMHMSCMNTRTNKAGQTVVFKKKKTNLQLSSKSSNMQN